MKKYLPLFLLPFILLSLSSCSGTDYLADVTKDTHSGCFTTSSNYLGFTASITYIHLGDNSAAVNASPGCAGVSGFNVPVSIPVSPAPLTK